MNEHVRRCPSVTREARRGAGRANPHQWPGEVKGIVYSAEKKTFAEQRDHTAQRESAGGNPDSVERQVGKTKKQTANKE